MKPRPYLFSAPAGPLRSLLDAKAQGHEPFTDDEAALDVMLAIDRDDLRPIRYYAARWKWTRYRVHATMAALTQAAQEWRSFYAAESGQSVRQVQPEAGQTQTRTGPDCTENAGVQPQSGQVQPEAGQYRPIPITNTRQGDTPLTPLGVGKAVGEGPSKDLSPKPQRARRKVPEPDASPPLPACIDPAVWADWAAHRREIRKPLSATTTKHQLRQLTTWTDAGHDPNEILRASIRNGWAGLFQPKADRDGSLTRRDRVQQDRDNPSAAYQRNAAIILAAIDP